MYVYTMQISLLSTELHFLQGHMRKSHNSLFIKNKVFMGSDLGQVGS